MSAANHGVQPEPREIGDGGRPPGPSTGKHAQFNEGTNAMTSDPATVLIVEDDRQLADTFAATLETDYDVRTAYDGDAGLGQLDESVDVVLLDRKMPGLSGDEVLAEIRDRDISCRVAMVTAVQPELDIVDMPFDDYLVKPVRSDALRDTVERLLLFDRYGDQVREYLARSVKQATLERVLSDSQLEQQAAYQELKADVAAMSEDLGDISAQFSESDFELILDMIIERMGGYTTDDRPVFDADQ